MTKLQKILLTIIIVIGLYLLFIHNTILDIQVYVSIALIIVSVILMLIPFKKKYVSRYRYRHKGTGQILIFGRDFEYYTTIIKDYGKNMNEMIKDNDVEQINIPE